MVDSITRRRFLKKSGQAGAATLTGLITANSLPGADDIPDVAVVHGDVSQAVARAFELLGGIDRYDKKFKQ